VVGGWWEGVGEEIHNPRIKNFISSKEHTIL
jgi:hypothetical protein